MPQTSLARHYLETAVATFKSQKRLAERALAQLRAADFHHRLDPDGNSVAVIVKHLAGNMRSRWRDFLTSDGEKPDRHRDEEFIGDAATPAELMQVWEAGWAELFSALDALTPQDLLQTVTIRGEKHSVLEAVERQTAHYAQPSTSGKSCCWRNTSEARTGKRCRSPKGSRRLQQSSNEGKAMSHE